MPGRPKKKRIRHASENDGRESISRHGRTMTCSKCWVKGHNKASCTSDQVVPPVKEKRKAGRPKVPKIDRSCIRSRTFGSANSRKLCK